MSEYNMICPICGDVGSWTESEPNKTLDDPIDMELFGTCIFCKTPMISCDKSLGEYARDYENFTCVKLDLSSSDTDKLFPIIERDYISRHPEQFDPAAKEHRLATIQKNRDSREARKHQPHCPKCRSTSIITQKQGFGVGKAAAGVLLTGNLLAAAAGGINANKNWNVCQKCGHKWKI